MQTLNFQCGHCGNLMAVGVEYLGLQVRCPHCGGIVIAPRELARPTGIQIQTPLFGGQEGQSSEDIFSESAATSDSLFDEGPSSPVPLSPPPSYEPPSYDSPTYSSPEYTPPSTNLLDEPYAAPNYDAVLGEEPSPPPAEPPPSHEPALPSQEDANLALEMTSFASAQAEPSSTTPEQYNGKATMEPPIEPTTSLSGERFSAGMPEQPFGSSVEPAATSATQDSSSPPAASPPVLVSAPLEQPFTTEPTPARPRTSSSGGGLGLFFPLFVMPLILYAIGMTLAAGFLYLRLISIPTNANPFEQMPDVDGDNPGVKFNKKLTLRFGKQDALAPLPERQIIGLNDTLRIGDLEVTPLRIERRMVRIFDERQGDNGEPEPLPTAPLVLTLRVKNCAEDYSFVPLDNYFDRYWNGKSGSAPLTILQAGAHNFFGGPAKWAPLKREGNRREFREWLEGRKNVDPIGLKPGESTETFVCTDGADEATVRHLFGEDLQRKKVGRPYQGNLLWRVQLRRGLIELGGKRYPATCVIGVRFTSRDYLQS